MANEQDNSESLKNWQGEDPRIDPNEPMSVQGFRDALSVLGSLYLKDERIQEDIKANLAWAEGLDEDAIITWEHRDGRTIPVVTHILDIPRDPTVLG